MTYCKAAKRAPVLGALSLLLLGALWQVVAEGGPEHVVGTFWGDADARPDVALEVSVLEALAQPARRSAIEVVPVAGCEFLYVLGVGSAVGRCGWGVACNCGTWHRFGKAAGFHVGVGAVSDRTCRTGLEVTASHV